MRTHSMLSKVALETPLPIGEGIHWLLSLGARFAIGVALGVLAARQMRDRHLHWSWALVALIGAGLVRQALGGFGAIVSIGLSIAAVKGRRWHRDDVEAGADLAKLAAARRSPSSVLLALLRAPTRRLTAACGRGAPHARSELAVGVGDDGRQVTVPFAFEGGGRHTLVVGATGSGKTVTQTWILSRAIERGLAAVVVDPKGDAGLRQALAVAAAGAGRSFHAWTPRGGYVYNPYRRGTASEIADKALAGERFTEPHYMRQAQRYLGHAVRALHDAGVEPSLGALVEYLQPDALEILARELASGPAERAFAYLDSLSARQRTELAGVRDRLAILAESDVGTWLDPRTPRAPQLDLLAAIQAGGVVYFDLDSDRRPLLTQMLGAAIVQDLQTVVAALQGRPVQTIIAVDEFSAIAAEHIVRLFARARSAGVSLLLGTQELTDLRLPGRERLLEQVLGNLSALIAHRQVVPESAALISELAGARGAWRVARHSDGRVTRTRTREQLLDPDQLTRLDSGQAAVLVLGRGMRIARMCSPVQGARVRRSRLLRPRPLSYGREG